MKKILIILGIFAVIVIGGIMLLFSSLDQIITAGIERFGSMTTQTEVKVSSVTLKLKSGEGSVKGIHIGNPSGFTSPDAFTLGDISIKIDPATVTKDVVVIDRIFISKPHVTYEINDSGQSNINIIKENIKQLQGKSAPEAAQEEEKGKAAVKLLIRQFEIEGGQIDVHIPVQPEPMTAKMPPIKLSDLGSGGKPPAEISATILSALVKNIGPAVAQVGVEQYLGKSVEDMKVQMQKQIDEKAGEAVEGLSQEAGKALNKFLGK